MSVVFLEKPSSQPALRLLQTSSPRKTFCNFQVMKVNILTAISNMTGPMTIALRPCLNGFELLSRSKQIPQRKSLGTGAIACVEL